MELMREAKRRKKEHTSHINERTGNAVEEVSPLSGGRLLVRVLSMKEAVQQVVSVAFCERRGQLSKRCYIIESRLEQKLTVKKDFYGKIRPEHALQCPSFHSGRMHFTHHSLHPHRFFLGVLHHSRRL
jgi:hypothetical protein